ncbi:MAG: pyrimidine-nucleoside phosphorylase [Tissierellia bacterium]|nr:pyrimidine-nucleoside phosphorylase [Tissierellia bacterium]
MNPIDIIKKKRDGENISNTEIEWFIEGYVNGEIPDYQVSAWLMASYINGLDIKETHALTNAIINSGDTIDLSSVEGIKVDKHSTGGVGDAVTLVLGPIVASCNVPFVKMSGRGLGHTGGTLDKLSSIKGLRLDLTSNEIIKQAKDIGIVICGQTGEIAPADKLLYSLRDVTATVNSMPLIAASIMGKKIAMGSDAILLDIKVGNGAFMKTLKEAQELGKTMVDIGKASGIKTIAILTDMEQPLGMSIGNSLEVIEAIDILNGEGNEALRELCLFFAAKTVEIAKPEMSYKEAYLLAKTNLDNGKALKKFREFIRYQGGDDSIIDNLSKLELSKIKCEVYANKSGYLSQNNALLIGQAAFSLGAGRLKKEDNIDLGAGIIIYKRVGDYINEGDLLATLYSDDENKISEGKKLFLSAISIDSNKFDKRSLIIDIISDEKSHD